LLYRTGPKDEREQALKARGEMPILPRIFVSGHRGGGVERVPDNTPAGVEAGINAGVSAVELDMIATTDGELVLFHGYDWPSGEGGPLRDISPGWLEQRARESGHLDVRGLSMADIRQLRYSVELRGKLFRDTRVYTADEVVDGFRNKVNFHVDPKGPNGLFIDLYKRYNLWDRVIMHFRALEYAREIKTLDSRVAVCWKPPGVGHFSRSGPAPDQRTQMETLKLAADQFRAIGGEMMVMQDVTPEKLRACHARGIAVTPRASEVGDTDGEAFLRQGVDAIMCDAPAKVVEAVNRVYGPDFVPSSSVTVRELFARRREIAEC